MTQVQTTLLALASMVSLRNETLVLGIMLSRRLCIISILLLFPWQPSTLISLRPRPRAASHGWTLGWSTLTSRRGCLMRRRWRLDSASSAYRYSLFWRLLSEQQGLKWEESQKFSFGSTTLLNCASILHNMSHSLFICNFKLDSWPLFTVSISQKWSLWWYRSESDTQSCCY